MRGERLCKSERIRHRTDFLRISKSAIKIKSRNFILLAEERPDNLTRVGITVSKKVGNAVARNRVKRLVREFYRLHKCLFLPSEIVFIARAGADRLDYSELCQELVNAVHKIGKQIHR